MSQKRKCCWDLRQQKLSEHVKLTHTGLSTATVSHQLILFRKLARQCSSPYSQYKTHAQTRDAQQFTLCNSKKCALRVWRRGYLFNSWICQPRFRVHVLMWNLCTGQHPSHAQKKTAGASKPWLSWLGPLVCIRNTSCWEVVQPLPHIFLKKKNTQI